MAKLLINIDVTGEAKVTTLDKSLNKLEHNSKNVDVQNKKTSSSFASMAVVAAAVAGSIYVLQKAMTAVVRSGFEFSKQMEDSKAGLSALSLAIQDKNIPLTERMTNANREAIVVMQTLQKVNAKTPHTLDQTNKIYKAMYVSMKNVGASSQDIVNITQKLSVAAGAAGIEFNSLLAGVDGLATGTVLANSDLGRFLGSLGLTNAELKNSNDVIKLLNTTLEDFTAIDTITTATSNLQNEWGALSETMTKDLFVGVKDGMNELSGLMKSMSAEDTENLRRSFNTLAISMTTALLGITKSVVFLADGFESLGARIAGVAFRLEHGVFLSDAESEALERMYAGTKKNIEQREEFITTLETSIDVMTRSIRENEKKTVAVITQEEKERILNETTKQGIEILGQATEAELNKIYADELATMGLDEFGDELVRTNDLLEYSVEAYGGAASAVDDYSNSINSLSRTLSASEQQGGTTGIYKSEVVAAGSWEASSSYRDWYNLQQGILPYMGGIGYADGGYTGNMGVNEVAGVVHGQEYVVNARTTKDLGLNGSMGIFQEISAKLDHLYEINLTTKRSLKTQKRTKTILAEA